MTGGLRYLSVCSGIEAATVAWRPLGWSAVAFSEVDRFASAALAHHYPHVSNWGDLTGFAGWPDAAIDLLVGGTPCQSFSIAGLRQGLDDPRGSLMLVYLAVARRARPRWVVWENVPGVLSADDGRAFGSLLGGLAELGYGFAYRILDAQYFGVPQRRQRVFVVGHLGDWRRAAAVLFERESLSGHPPPCREAGARPAIGTLGGTSPGGGWRFGADEAAAGQLIAKPVLAGGHANNPLDETLVVFDTTQITSATNRSQPKAGDPCHPVAATSHAPLIAFAHQAGGNRTSSGAFMVDQSPTLGRTQTMAIQSAMTVRRLTPRECERLQGFPDDYTLIPYRGKPAADGPRYRALGNSMAVPCMDWIGRRIQQVGATA